MNNLQILIKLRGISMNKLAEATGFGMHSVQKVVKGSRGTPSIQRAVAGCLGLQVEQCFGPLSSRPLQRMIAIEIKRSAQEYKNKLERKLLTVPTLPSEQRAVND